MGEYMIKTAIATLGLIAMSLSALAQESSASASTTAAPGVIGGSTSTGSLQDSSAGAKSSPWGASVLLLVDRPNRVKQDAEALEYDTQTQFNLSYRFSKSDKLAVVQRLNRSFSVSGREDLEKYSLANLRIQETHSSKMFGADFVNLTRLTLPTVLESRRDTKMIGAVTILPDLSWAMNPKLSLGYTGYFLGNFFGDKSEKQDDGSIKTLESGSRSTFYMINQGYVQYSFSDKLSFQQALGLANGSKNTNNNLTRLVEDSRTIEASSTLAYNPTKIVALTIAMIQSAPLTEGSTDAGGAPLTYEKDIVPFARDQTTYEFTGSVSF
jgi:hypothetical protein